MSKTLKVSDAKTVLGRKEKLLAVFVVVMAFLLVGLFIFARPDGRDKAGDQQAVESSTIGRIGEGYFNFEVADTQSTRTLGLSGRDGLRDTDALLFVFDEPSDQHCIWMKDMLFSIDILWFDENRTLVYEKRDISPATYPESFCPGKPTQYIVEVASGVADNNQIKLGDTLELEL